MWKPERILIFLIFLANIVNLFTRPIYFSLVLIMSAGLLYLLTLMVSNRKETQVFNIDITVILLLAFLVVALIPHLFQSNLEYFWGNYASLISAFVIYAIIGSFKYSNALVRNICIFFTAYIAILTLQLLNLYISTGGYVLKLNIDLPYGKSNSLASPLLLSYLFWLYFEKNSYAGSPLRWKFLRRLNLFVSLGGLLLTQSLAAILVAILLTFPYLRRLRFFKAALVPVLVLVLLFIFIPTYKDRTFVLRTLKLGSPDQIRLIQTQQQSPQFDLTHGRLGVYAQALKNFSISPIIGRGLGNLEDFNDLFQESKMFRSHNLILDILGQTGIFGFLLYFCLLLLILQKLWTRKILSEKNKLGHPIFPAIFYASLGVLIHSLFEPNFLSFNFDSLIWVFLAFSIVKIPHTSHPVAIRAIEKSNDEQNI